MSDEAPPSLYAIKWRDRLNPDAGWFLLWADGPSIQGTQWEVRTPFQTLREAQAVAARIKDRQETRILTWKLVEDA